MLPWCRADLFNVFSLAHNGVGPDGAIALAKVHEKNQTLTILM